MTGPFPVHASAGRIDRPRDESASPSKTASKTASTVVALVTGGLLALAVLFAVVLSFASNTPPAPPGRVRILVVDEAKAPIAGAELASHAEVITKTDNEGHAEVELAGREGTMFEVEIHCPNIYRSPAQPLVVRRLIGNGGPAPEYVAHCNRLRHTLSVTIHTEGGANMPVRHLGKEVAHTDESGTARVIIEGQVQERIDLVIDTTDAKFAKLHPQNPLASFEISEKDEAKSFEMKFTSDPKPVRRAVKRSGPKQF